MVRLDPPDTDGSPERSTRPTFRALGRIDMLLSIDGLWSSRSNSALHIDLAVVHLFDPIASCEFPWDERAMECGLPVCAGKEGSVEVFSISALEAPAVFAECKDADDTDIIISFSCDQEGAEPESYFDLQNEEPQEAPEQGNEANQE
jgi:hypothetical protein